MDKKIRQIVIFIVLIIVAMHTKDVKNLLIKFNFFDAFDDGVSAGIIQLVSIGVSICIGLIVFVVLKKYFKPYTI